MTFTIVLHIFLGVLIVISIIAISTFIVSIYFKYCEKHYNLPLILGKLSDDKSEDDIKKATEYLKLTNNNTDGIS